VVCFTGISTEAVYCSSSGSSLFAARVLLALSVTTKRSGRFSCRTPQLCLFYFRCVEEDVQTRLAPCLVQRLRGPSRFRHSQCEHENVRVRNASKSSTRFMCTRGDSAVQAAGSQYTSELLRKLAQLRAGCRQPSAPRFLTTGAASLWLGGQILC